MYVTAYPGKTWKHMSVASFLISPSKLSRLSFMEGAKAFLMPGEIATVCRLAGILAAAVNDLFGVDRPLADYVHEPDIMSSRPVHAPVQVALVVRATICLTTSFCADVNHFVAQGKVVDTVANLRWQTQEGRVAVVPCLA